MTSEIATPTNRAQPREGAPVVSICIPTFNGAAWIVEAVESALTQDYRQLEIIVCDDASSDDTVALARRFDDPRVRVLANHERVGLARNWNRCIEASVGDYVKPLMHDDRLAPTCVRQMLDVMEAHPAVGLVFSPRQIQLDDPSDPESLLWEERFGVVHGPLGPLSEVNDGRSLFEHMKGDRFRRNWIGEPSVVMVRRRALVSLGLFNVRLQQLTDLEMWLRIAFFHDIGFVPDPLATFRVHRRSASAANERSGVAWLDRIWLLEGLRVHPEIRSTLGAWSEVLIWSYVFISSARRLIGNQPGAPGSTGADLRDYLRFRFRRDRRALHEVLTEDRDREAPVHSYTGDGRDDV